jgi:hypothetical protein
VVENRDALFGPVQFMTFKLNTPAFDGRIIDELIALEGRDIITIIDAAILVRESEDDYQAIDIDAAVLPGHPLLGMVVGGLLGLGAAGEEGAAAGAELGAEAGIDPVSSEDLFDELADDIPVGGVAAVVAFEQTWARGIMGAIRDSGGEILGDDILHAEDLIDAGIALGEALDETSAE